MSTGKGFKSSAEYQRQLEKISASSTPLLSAGEQKAPPMTELETLRADIGKLYTLIVDEVKALQVRADAITFPSDVPVALKPWPQVGDKFWTIFSDGSYAEEICKITEQLDRYLSIGNVFRTEQEAIDERDRRKVAAIMREKADGGVWTIRKMKQGGSAGYIIGAFDAGYPSAYGMSALAINEATFTSELVSNACRDRIVTELSDGGTRDGMARLLELWAVK